jgi:CHAD domain-containing protein
MREIADKLGSVRDMDVRIEWLQSLRASSPPEAWAGLDLLVDRSRRERERARVPMIALLERLDGEGYEEKFLRWVREGRARNG